MTSRWKALTVYATDGRLEMSNNAAERAIRPLALGRKNYLFSGSDAGGDRAAVIYTIVEGSVANLLLQSFSYWGGGLSGGGIGVQGQAF